MTTKDGLE